MDSTDTQIYPMRLQKFLARSGVASRRGSENLMTAGRVRVNGEVVTELGYKVDPLTDTVTVDGKPVTLDDGCVYLMLYKPADVVTTMDDPHGRKCVKELVPVNAHPALFPVGRLDMDTTGLLLFTTNGEAAYKALHPRHHVNKHYIALVKGKVTNKNLEALRKGITLDDGPCAPAEVSLLDFDDPAAKPVLDVTAYPNKNSIVELTIHEGRKRQVKRMLEKVGHPVIRLHRDSFGSLKLTGVEMGQWRMLEPCEVKALLDQVNG